MANPEHLETLLHGGVTAWNRRQRNRVGQADLSGAVLRSERLLGVNFTETDLRDSDLRDAEMQGAILTDADLREANLQGANLAGAKLTGAMLGDTNICNVVLRQARGLETCEHKGPSAINNSTIAQSGRLPVEFLRGVGLTDWQTQLTDLYSPGLTYEQVNDIVYRVVELRGERFIHFYSCFISYSHQDKSFAQRLHNHLQDRGIRCWLDEKQLLPGLDIRDEIDRGIRLWDKIIVCCSRNSLAGSTWVDAEIEKGLQKEERLWQERKHKVLALIPLNLDGYVLSGQWESGKSSYLRSRFVGDFVGWESDNAKFEAGLEKLVAALRADDGGRETPPDQKL